MALAAGLVPVDVGPAVAVARVVPVARAVQVVAVAGAAAAG